MLQLYFYIALFVQIFNAYPIATQVNNARAANNVPPLKLNPILTLAAQLHSEDQAAMEFMSHTGSDNSNFSTRLERLGFDYEYAGENVAWNQKSEDEVMQAWIKSPGHYRNIVNPKYTLFGAAVNNFYWTQEFGTLFE